MQADTIDDIKKDIERLEAEIKADRATRGVPEKPPEEFVPPAMTWALIERCKPAQQFALKYTQLCNGANEVLSISDEQADWLRKFLTYTELIRQSVDQWPRSYGIGLGSAISTILGDDDSEYKDDSFVYVKRLFQGLELANLTINATHFDRPEPVSEEQFAKEYEELIRHYESIQHLY